MKLKNFLIKGRLENKTWISISVTKMHCNPVFFPLNPEEYFCLKVRFHNFRWKFGIVNGISAKISPSNLPSVWMKDWFKSGYLTFLLKVSKFQNQIFLFSFPPINERNCVLNSALASKTSQIKKMKALYFIS